MQSGLKFELAQMVESAIVAEGSAARLSKKIVTAVRRLDPQTGDDVNGIDPRTLKKLAADDPTVQLSAAQLRMLDAYFAPRGMSLAVRPLLASHSILPHVARSEKMLFLLGAYPRKEEMRIDVSHWDFKSVTHLVNAMNSRAPRAGYTMEEVIYQDGMAPTEFSRQSWFRRIADDTSIIAIGSSRVNHAAEYLLSEMFPSIDSRPFVFTSSDGSPSFQSAFWLPFNRFAALGKRRGIKLDDRASDILRNHSSGARALVADKNLFVSDPLLRVSPRSEGNSVGESFKTYGIVAVQRRAAGGIWVAVCGLSGPGTFGSACAIDTAVGLMPHVTPGRHSEPLWVVVEIGVQRKPESADPREVVSQQIIYPLLAG
ncbi:MAG TPA: hypothetical protein VIB38_11690 [Aestuariivirgaceae bacterium]